MKIWRDRVNRVLKGLASVAVSTSLMAGLVNAEDIDSKNPYPAVPAKVGEFCTVCGVPLDEKDVALIVKGRRFPVDKTMVQAFLESSPEYFRAKQVRTALFQEEFGAPSGTAQSGVGWKWFLVGLYVLTSVVFGGFSGYVAVSKGLSPISHFFAGFVLNAFGFLYVLTRPARLKTGIVPPGLVKVPVTHAPVACPKCGNTNHPSAARCLGCGALLTPSFQSEVARAD